jgi:hypothetical protein
MKIYSTGSFEDPKEEMNIRWFKGKWDNVNEDKFNRWRKGNNKRNINILSEEEHVEYAGYPGERRWKVYSFEAETSDEIYSIEISDDRLLTFMEKYANYENIGYGGYSLVWRDGEIWREYIGE